jgi:polyphosphate:AMP phosphotransferase
MFESVEVGSKTSKQDYGERVPKLRVDLINAQYDLKSADFPVLILISGDDRVGANEVMDVLHEWMDARYMRTRVFGRPTEEELERPRFWRYWRALPQKGEIGLFLGAWDLSTISDLVNRRISGRQAERRVAHIVGLEKQLVDDGTLLLKFWLHLPKKELAKRLKQAKKHPARQPLVDKQDWLFYDVYGKAMPMAEQVLRRTDRGESPWHFVESTDERHRNLSIAETIRSALVERLERNSEPAIEVEPKIESAPNLAEQGPLSKVDLSSTIAHKDYRKQLDKLQLRVSRLMRRARGSGVSAVLVFEGWDAAGKGGVIRRITRALPASDYRIIPIAAPTDEEKARHYLWRFWRHLPRAGRLLIFDRSWYGRVLVERVEGFAREDEWRRAYAEINDFEAQLCEHGMLVQKFWLHIDPDEQLARFKAREKTPYKKYKITDEDYRNREKWDDYCSAVNEMVTRTSTGLARWYLVPANDKRWARIEVLRTVCDGLKDRLKK